MNNTYNVLTLKFSEAALEKKFGNIFDKTDILTFRIIYLFVLLGNMFILFLEIFGSDFSSENAIDTQNYFQLVAMTVYLLFGFVIFSKSFLQKTKVYLIIFYFLVIVARAIYEWWIETLSKIMSGLILSSMINMLLGPITLLVLAILTNFLGILRAGAHQLILENMTESQERIANYSLFCYIFLIISFGVLTVIYNYKYEKLIRNEFLAKHNLELEAEHIKNVLSLLLPKFIKDQIDHDGTNAIAEDQGEVSVLFCDIVDFDSIMEKEPKIVDFLDNVYRNFDNFCEQNGVQKIETVGKTYMACSGLRACDITLPKQLSDVDQTERIIYLANDMRKYVDQKSLSEGKKMTLKIGIHYGRVIAGVIGYHKPQFSLIGDTINTASRVCSTSESQIITLSEPAHERVKGNSSFTCKERKVEAKGKGIMKTYQILKIKEKYDRGFRSMRSNKFKYQKTSEIRELELMQNLTRISRIKSQDNRKPASSKLLYRQSTFKSEKNRPDVRPSLFFLMDKGAKNDKLEPVNSPSAGLHFRNEHSPIRHSPFRPNLNPLSPRMDPKGVNFSEMTKVNETEKKGCLHEGITKINEARGDIKQATFMSKLNSMGMLQKSNVEIEGEEKTSMKSIREIKEDEEPYYFNDNITKFNPMKVSDEDSDDDDLLAEDVLKPNFLMLFSSKQRMLAHILDEEIIEIYKNENMISLLVLFLVYLIKTFALLFWLKKTITINPEDHNLVIAIISLRGCFQLFLFSYIIAKKLLIVRKMTKFLVFVIFLLAIATSLFCTAFLEFRGFSDSCEIELMELMLIYLVMIKMGAMHFVDSAAVFIVIFLVRLICLLMVDTPFIFQNIILLMFCCVLVLQSYSRMSKLVKNFNNLNITHFRQKQQKNLLMHLLPKHICDRILVSPSSNHKFQKSDLTDNLSNVTLLFADIANFTKYSSSVTPEIVVAMLKNLFTEFDKICLAYNLYKVYTIGDCYVVMSLNEGSRPHSIAEEVHNVLSMGFAMIEIIKTVRERINFKELDMRIGVHTGDVLGGIVGTNIVRYDIYGRNVMIANKMESNGKLGRINVSETTKNILQMNFEGEFEFEEQQEIFIKSMDLNIKNFLIKRPGKILG